MAAIQRTQQSPLSKPSLAQANAHVSDAEEASFWEINCYYEATHIQHWSTSLDEEFEEPLQFHAGTIFCTESVEERPVCLGDDGDAPTSTYVILRALDPRGPDDNSTLRFGFWPGGQSRNEYLKLDEPLLILALAGTGLTP